MRPWNKRKKPFSAQVQYMILLPLFYFAFCLLYDPFRIQEYYDFGRFLPSFHIVMLSCILLGCIALSRLIYFFIDRGVSFKWWQFALWCFGEVVVASAFMALYTVLFRHEGRNFFPVLATCFKFTAMTLIYPYALLALLQVINEQDEALRSKDAPQEESLIRFYDEHKRLKLTISPASLLYVKSEFNYLKINFLSGSRVKEYTLRASMKSLSESIPPQVLTRCQRSYFVNPAHVKVLWKDKEGFIFADLDVPDLPSIPVSKQYYDTIANLL